MVPQPNDPLGIRRRSLLAGLRLGDPWPVSILAALEEIRAAGEVATDRSARAALARLDVLIGKLEDLNLHEIHEVPLPLHFEIARALEGLVSEGVTVPESTTRALELVFAGQARILRGLYPEYQDEFDDE